MPSLKSELIEIARINIFNIVSASDSIQEEIAFALGHGQPYVSMLLNGKRNLKMEHIIKIAEKLGMAPGELLEPIPAEKAAIRLKISRLYSSGKHKEKLEAIEAIVNSIDDKDLE